MQLFCDGSYKEGKGSAFSAVAWGDDGQLVARVVGFQAGASDSVEAELRGAILAAHLRAEYCEDLSRQWILNLDCHPLYLMLSGRSTPARPELRELTERFLAIAGPCVLNWVKRSENRDADLCARMAYARQSSPLWLVPEDILTAAELDARLAFYRARKAKRRRDARARRRAMSAAVS